MMVKVFFYVLSVGLLISILTISSCVKEEDDLISQNCSSSCTIVSGKFTTQGGSRGLSGIPLTLYWKNGIIEGGGTIRKKVTAKTDANGDFRISFSMRDDELKQGYFDIDFEINEANYLVFGGKSFSLPALRRDTMIVTNYLIPYKAYLDLKISNPKDINSTDHFYSQIRFSYGNYSQGIGDWIDWSNLILSPVTIGADKEVIIESNKLKNGVRTTKYDTLKLAKDEKRIYSVTF
jgi:hypothetical protein